MGMIFKNLEMPDGITTEYVAARIVNQLDGKVDIKTVIITPKKIDLAKFRLHESIRHNVNMSKPQGSRRPGRWLTWAQKAEVNNVINKVLDILHVNCDVATLSGRLKIREGDVSFTEEDWKRQVGYDVAGVNLGGKAFELHEAMQPCQCEPCKLRPSWP